jgi:hypothetical protein
MVLHSPIAASHFAESKCYNSKIFSGPWSNWLIIWKSQPPCSNLGCFITPVICVHELSNEWQMNTGSVDVLALCGSEKLVLKHVYIFIQPSIYFAVNR